MRGRTPRWLKDPRAQVAILGIGGLGLLTMMTRLIPSAGWQHGRYVASLLVALPAAVFYFRRFPVNQLFTHGVKSAFKRIVGIAASLVVVAACSFMLVGAILPGAWTYAFGEKVATPAHLSTWDRKTNEKRRKPCRYSVRGAELSKPLLSDEMCLTEEEYRQLPEHGWMLLEGRRSVFGTLVTGVSAEKTVEAP